MGLLGGLGKAIGGGLSVFGAVLSFAPGLQWVGIGMMIAGGILTSIAATDQPNIKKPANFHQINTRSSREPLPLLYGECLVGVNKTFYHQANPYLWIVCELGEGEIYGIEREDGSYYTTTNDVLPSSNPPLVYFDQKLWTEYNPDNVTMYFYNGTTTQGVNAALSTASGGKWDQSLRRTAYLVVRLEFETRWFKQEPDITVKIKGLKITDPIASTTDYENNAALVAYDFLTRGSQRGGLGVAAARVDSASLESARDYCTAKGWVFNAPIRDQQAASDNLDSILACYRGAIIYSDNVFKFVFADLNYNSVALALTEDDIVEGSLRIEMPDISDRPNAVNVTYFDEDSLYKQNDLTISDQAAIVSEGDYREMKVSLPGLSNATLAGKMGNYILERERLRQSVTFTAGERCMALEPMDVITLTHSTPAWSAQKLRVNSISINPDHTVSVSCYIDAITLYDDIYNLTAHSFNTTTLLDPSAVPPEVESVSVSEETYSFRLRTFSRLKVTFSPPTDYPWYDHVEVWVSLDDSAWAHQFNATDDFTIDPVEEGQTYYIKLVTVNVFGTKKDFATAPKWSVIIDGKSDTAPSSLSGISAIYTGGALNIYGDRVTDDDVELYEFRLGASWSGSVFLASARAPNLSLAGVKPGSHTIWCNTYGANGMYGDTPRGVSVTIPTPPIGWTLVSTFGPSTVGTTSNSELYVYNSTNTIKVSHATTLLTGSWQTTIFDASTSKQYLAYIAADTVVIGTGSLWTDLFPTTDITWEQAIPSPRTWIEAFSPDAAPQIRIKLQYGDSTALASTVERMEILSGVVTGRYFRAVVEITDPQASIYGLAELPVLRLAT